MKKSLVTMTFAGMTAIAGLAAPVGAANAQAACYATNDERFYNERIVIDVEKQGLLVNPWYDLVALVFGGMQTAYSAHGKHVNAEQALQETQANGSPWEVSMAAVTGTVDVSAPFLKTNRNASMHATETGAHMGLVAQWVRGYDNEGLQTTALPVTFDCGSEEISPTPKTWICQVYNEGGTYWGKLTYLKVANMADDERCNLFQSLPDSDTVRPGTMTPVSF